MKEPIYGRPSSHCATRTAQTGLSGVDNDTRCIDSVRLGAVAGLDAGTSGTLFVDGFDSRRASALGPTAGASTTAITYTYDPLQRANRG